MRVLMWLGLVGRAAAGYEADRLENALSTHFWCMKTGLSFAEDFISEKKRSSG